MWPGSAGYDLTWRLAAVAMAGYGLAWPSSCGRWLPVWLPGISLATLMFEAAGLWSGPRTRSSKRPRLVKRTASAASDDSCAVRLGRAV